MKLPIKIIKTSIYDDLIKQLEESKSEIETLKYYNKRNSQEKKILEEQILNCALDFRTKRCIIGERSSGKTTFIKKRIIRNDSNYFYAGINCSDVKPEQSYRYDTGLSVRENADKLIEIIRKNKDKLIIIDDFQMFACYFNFGFLVVEGYNFVISVTDRFKSKKLDLFLDESSFIHVLKDRNGAYSISHNMECYNEKLILV